MAEFDPVLTATIGALHWRLVEAAHRISEATDAKALGHADRVMRKLYEIEPLVFDAGRVLSGLFVLRSEGRRGANHSVDSNE